MRDHGTDAGTAHHRPTHARRVARGTAAMRWPSPSWPCTAATSARPPLSAPRPRPARGPRPRRLAAAGAHHGRAGDRGRLGGRRRRRRRRLVHHPARPARRPQRHRLRRGRAAPDDGGHRAPRAARGAAQRATRARARPKTRGCPRRRWTRCSSWTRTTRWTDRVDVLRNVARVAQAQWPAGHRRLPPGRRRARARRSRNVSTPWRAGAASAETPHAGRPAMAGERAGPAENLRCARCGGPAVRCHAGALLKSPPYSAPGCTTVTAPPRFPRFSSHYQARVVDALDSLVPPEDQPPEDVHRAMRYTLLAPSKRVRAALALLCADVCGREDRGRSAWRWPPNCPRLLADPRRPPVHGRRDDAPGAAGEPRRVRRGDGAAGELRSARPVLQDADAALRRPPGREARRALRRDRRHRRADRRPGRGPAGHQPRDHFRAAGAHPPAEDRRAVLRGRHGRRAGRRRLAVAGDGARPPTPRTSAWRSRSWTTCSTWRATRADTGKTVRRDEKKTTFVSFSGPLGARELAGELCATANAALAPFGGRADRLRELADFVARRTR